MTDKNEGAPTAASTKEIAKPEEKKTPAFVTPEELVEKFDDVLRQIADRAFNLFHARGGEFGKELDDWFKAENEFLRPVKVEINETDEAIFVNATVPGYKPEEIEVSVNGDELIISGETKSSKRFEKADTIMREWNSDRFFRRLLLPSAVRSENVVTKLSDGMLELTLPKIVAEPAPKASAKSA